MFSKFLKIWASILCSSRKYSDSYYRGNFNYDSPPTPLDFPFAQGNVNPSPLWNFCVNEHSVVNNIIIIYLIDDPKAGLSEHRKLAQENINSISSYKILSKTWKYCWHLEGVHIFHKPSIF